MGYRAWLNDSKVMALVAAMVMVLSLGVTAMAGTITINRDDSWNEDGESTEAIYTYHKIMDAVITPVEGEEDDLVVYTVNTKEKAEAINNTGVLEAKLAADDKYYVTKKGTPSEVSILNAIKGMVSDNTNLFPGISVTSADNPVVIEGLDDGYYLIEASNGKDVIIDTIGNVTIDEKNDYPTVDKKQSEITDNYDDQAVSVGVGSYINYEITVSIPTDATKQIVVVDKMSAGLEYDDATGLTVAQDAAYSPLTATDADYDNDAAWQIKFDSSVVEEYRGQNIVITYRAKVTSDALVDTDKENEVTLKYDESHYILKDKVNYEIYFAGIYKVDPNDETADMSGVKFTLADKDGNPVNVTYDEDNGYYVVDPDAESNEVVTSHDDDDYYTIKIRGLDGEIDYVLTETETKAGYNLLDSTVTLTKTKDAGDAFGNKQANTFDRVENNKGSTLPSTGGIGTTIFYVAGAVLILGAGVLLITRRRMKNV